MPVNSQYFSSIDTEAKAYWLGFIYADGYVTGDVFGIKLSLKDISHLEKLKKAIESHHKIGTYKSKSGYNDGNEYCSLTINNRSFVTSLLAVGVDYRKS